MNIPTDQSLDYLDGWCVGWNRARLDLVKPSKKSKKFQAHLDGWNARKHLEKEIKRRNKNKKALNKILNKEK